MAHITGTDRAQVLLLPDSVEDYVGADNPVRFIDAFVDSLDLAGAGFERAEPKETGRPGYDPADLLKLYIYGYLNRVRSSRRLEAETHRNLEVIWLLRRLRPDFKTIADFRRENREAFRQVFRDFVKVCRSLELFGRELIAVDGTRIKAVNSRDRNFTEAKLRRELAASQERLERHLQQMDEMDAADAADESPGKGRVRDLAQKIAALRERRARLETHRKVLQDRGEEQLSLTDPDARAMHSGTGVGVGYNVQIAVDAKHKLIAEQQVHSQVSDLGLLAETAGAVRARAWTSSGSMRWPTRGISRSRILPGARRRESRRTYRSRNAARPVTAAGFRRRGSATTQGPTPMPALTGRASSPCTPAKYETRRWSTTPIAQPAEAAP